MPFTEPEVYEKGTCAGNKLAGIVKMTIIFSRKLFFFVSFVCTSCPHRAQRVLCLFFAQCLSRHVENTFSSCPQRALGVLCVLIVPSGYCVLIVPEGYCVNFYPMPEQTQKYY